MESKEFETTYAVQFQLTSNDFSSFCEENDESESASKTLHIDLK